MSSAAKPIIIATRGSALALAQANLIFDQQGQVMAADEGQFRAEDRPDVLFPRTAVKADGPVYRVVPELNKHLS